MLQLEAIQQTRRLGGAEVPILHPIDLTILRGEYVAIVGASGSGKSTLMQVMGGLEPPSAGCVFLDGIDVAALDDRTRTDLRNRRIGFVFQQFHLLPRLTALENVMLPLVYAGWSRPERQLAAARMLARVGLTDRLGHRPDQLSGGQQQRVALARALVNEPDLLLADEPTGALDSRTGSEVIDRIEALHEWGLTIVLVTHDRELARRAGRIVELRDGRIVADSSAPARWEPACASRRERGGRHNGTRLSG